jgi:hypothetical protein
MKGEFEYMSVRVNFAFEKSEICIENSTKPNGDMRGESRVVSGEW